MNSINYYNENSKSFIENTFNANMSKLYSEFEQYLNIGDSILDLGCDSGRDSLYFKNKGYNVYAIDGSQEMVKYCKKFLGDRVTCKTFEEFETQNKYNAIWACASLLHVEETDLLKIVKNIVVILRIMVFSLCLLKIEKKTIKKIIGILLALLMIN